MGYLVGDQDIAGLYDLCRVDGVATEQGEHGAGVGGRVDAEALQLGLKPLLSDRRRRPRH